jgi:hypothetical protein
MEAHSLLRNRFPELCDAPFGFLFYVSSCAYVVVY